MAESYQAVHSDMITLRGADRRAAEPGVVRGLLDYATTFIPAHWLDGTRFMLRTGIYDSDPRGTYAAQRTYRHGFAVPLDTGKPPNFLSVQTLRCLFFEFVREMETKLERHGWAWMLRTDVQFDGTGQFVRDPLDPGCPWIPVIPPAMPARFKTTTRRAEDRDQPIYTRWKDGTLTVRQAFIDFDFPATESECVQCEDRIELDEFGKVLFRGTPRGVSFHNAEYHLAALRSGGIRRRRMAFASQLPQPNVRKNADKPASIPSWVGSAAPFSSSRPSLSSSHSWLSPFSRLPSLHFLRRTTISRPGKAP
jgi:hypothetical protein